MLASQRVAVRQSEIAFIDAARLADWPNARVESALGLPSGSLDQHYAHLVEVNENSHPSRDPEPWTAAKWSDNNQKLK